MIKISSRRSSGAFTNTSTNTNTNTNTNTKFAPLTKALLASTLALCITGCERIELEREKWSLKSDGKTIDTYVFNADVHTQAAGQPTASAFAMSKGEIVAVGDDGYIQALAPDTARAIDAANAQILPGFHDAHIHVLMALTAGTCDIDNEGVNAQTLVAFLNYCLAAKQLADDERIILSQFAPTTLMQDMTPYTTIREALDAVSTTHPVFALGSDGHAYAGNSLALTYAQLPDMAQAVPITKESLAGFWADRGFAQYFGVDENGEPDGVVKDAGAYEVIQFAEPSPEALLNTPDVINRYVHSVGVTSVQDAWVPTEQVPLWQAIAESGEVKMRATLNLVMNGDQYHSSEGLDIDQMVADSKAFDQSLANYPTFKADAVKVMLDGVIEYPTQTAATLHPYLKPVVDESMKVTGYVDHNHEACAEITKPLTGVQDELFNRVNGFGSAECVPNYGILEFEQDELTQLVTRLDSENILAHIHALGDRAVQVALNAIEAARDANNTDIPHSLAHTQLVDPSDVARAGRLQVGFVPTFSWMAYDWEYDITVKPFFDSVSDLADLDDMYRTDSYTHQHSYPVASLARAGALVGAGSDAPVDVRSPRPFGNIAVGLSRASVVENPDGLTKQVVWNENERMTIDQLVKAYTINGAKLLRQDDIVGSIEVGKRADFIVLDRDIYQLAEQGEFEKIANTRVMQTWFDGELVYTAE